MPFILVVLVDIKNFLCYIYRGDFVKVYGVIAEYNPFHLGHLYQIKKIKEYDKNSLIIALVSSCFTQRGDLSIVDKWERTNILIDNGIDLVVEFPFGFASQGADIFAYGAIKILDMLKIDTLVFGVETMDVESLKQVACLQLYSKEYNKMVKNLMDNGVNYPTAMSTAIYNFMSLKIDKANDLLALSYVKEIIRQKLTMEPLAIKRTNNYHDMSLNNKIISGSAIRCLIREDKDVSRYVVGSCNYYNKDRNIFFNMLKYQIINNINSLDKFNTVDEGIENRIRKVIFKSNSWEELIYNIKTKRYTYNKVNRMLVHILTNFTKEDNSCIDIDYIRLLGFGKEGQKYLNQIKKIIHVPIITKYKPNLSRLLDIEFRVNAIYASVIENGDDMILKEYSHKPIIGN